MNSAFFEFNVATSALFTAKNGLSITSHNISNSSTKGYTRQVALQRASEPLPGVCGKGMVGTGSDVYGIDQIRDFYLDKKYWEQKATFGEYSQKNDQLELLETAFSELSTTGISSSINDFLNSISGLTFSAGDKTYRTSVINFASSFADTMNAYAESLRTQQRDVNDEIQSLVKTINSIGDQIVGLNKQIFTYEIDGNKANDLRDQRALLIDELSQYVNTEVKEIESENGNKLIILINGQDFVNHFDNIKLNCVARDEDHRLDSDDAPGLYDLKWSDNVFFSTRGLSGELKGLLDIRDGNVNAKIADDDSTGDDEPIAPPAVKKSEPQDYKGIPYYIDKLNTLVQTIAKAFNEGKHLDDTDIEGMTGHINGYDANGNQGNLLFTYKDDEGNYIEDPEELDYSKITAFNFSLSDLLLHDSSRLAASSMAPPNQESNNEIILEFTTIRNNGSLFKEGNVFDYVNGVSSELAIDKRQSQSFNDFYEELTTTTDNQRISVSGVSLNEEITSMLKYQQLYVASAKLMQSISQVYDTLINRLGV